MNESGAGRVRPVYVVVGAAVLLVVIFTVVLFRTSSEVPAPVPATPTATPTAIPPLSPPPPSSSSTSVRPSVSTAPTPATTTGAPRQSSPTGGSASDPNPDNQPSVDPDNRAQDVEGTPEYAVRMYLYASRSIDWRTTSASQWVLDTKPYMSARLYRSKLAQLKGVRVDDSPGWEQVVAAHQWTRPQEIRVLTVNDTKNKRTMQATFRYETDTTSGKTLSDSPQVAQYTVVEEGGRWVVDVEQQPAN